MFDARAMATALRAHPARIVAQHRVDTPLAERDESWVFTRTAEFIRWPDIRTAFALPELP